MEGWSRPAGSYTRDTERDRTDYYSRGQGGRQGGPGDTNDDDIDDADNDDDQGITSLIWRASSHTVPSTPRSLHTQVLIKPRHKAGELKLIKTLLGGSTVQFSGNTATDASQATAGTTQTTTTVSATTSGSSTHPKSILRQTTTVSNADSERNDGSLSDTALGGPGISSIHNKGGMGECAAQYSTGVQNRFYRSEVKLDVPVVGHREATEDGADRGEEDPDHGA